MFNKKKFFCEKNIVAVLFFRSGLYAFPYSKYKTFSKLTEAWQYLNVVCHVDEFQLSIMFCN